MENELRQIESYPDINFINGYTMKKLENDMLTWYKEKRKELTGEDIVLAAADDRRILLQTGAYFIFMGYMYSDDAGKMGFLKYSRGSFLENLGALKHIYRKAAAGATTTIRFSINQQRQTTTGIPKGTRLTAGDGIYFVTDQYSEIKTGRIYVDVSATCAIAGRAGNEYELGDIKTIVDPIPYIDNASNITKPGNGTDIEDDESLRARIYIAPAAYSTAGTVDSYKYHIKEFNSEVTDMLITSPAPCVVEIKYLLKDGNVPGEESLNTLFEYLSQPSIKPLTDYIKVLAPNQVDYDINMVYYINRSDKNRAEIIQNDVELAVEQYRIWQQSKMGRDVNPNELIRLVLSAGAKRAEIISPAFKVIESGSVASVSMKTVSYGGIEDD